MEWLIIVGFLGLAIAGAMGVRNECVYLSRMRVLRRIRDLCRVDIAYDRPWRWRYGLLERISYEEQLFKFWRSVGSFFDDADELRP